MGLKKNFIYNSIVTLSNYVYPFVVFPYISRTLGVEYVGICNFIDTIINYFIIFSMLGINIIGIREVAASKQHPKKLNKIFSSLLTLNAIFTFMAAGILIICTLYFDRLYSHKHLVYIGILKLIFNFLLIEWLYTGLEEFKYITQRTLIIKSLYIVFIFIFVQESTHYYRYFFLTTLVVVANAIINITHSRKYVSFAIRNLSLRKYIKPYFTLGLYMVLTNMYTSFNIIFLGFISTDSEVGYLSTSNKIITVFLSLYTAWTSVVMPRMSYLFAEKKHVQFQELIDKSISVLLCFSLPVIAIGLIFSKDIIMLIAGQGYEKASELLKILIPLIFVIGYNQILVLQVLMPCKNDYKLIQFAAISAGIGLFLNLLLVPHFLSIGSCIAWLSAEISVLFLAQIYVNKLMRLHFPFQLFLRNVLAYLPAIAICDLIYRHLPDMLFIRLSVGILFIMCYFILIQKIFLKDKLILNRFKIITQNLKQYYTNL